MKKLFYISAVLAVLSMVACEPDVPLSDSPHSDITGKLAGSWSVSEQSRLYKQSAYTVTIEQDTASEDQLIVYNLYQIGPDEPAVLNVNYNLSVMIARQAVCETYGALYIEGEGTVGSNYRTIQLSYTVDDGADVDTVTAVLTKK